MSRRSREPKTGSILSSIRLPHNPLAFHVPMHAGSENFGLKVETEYLEQVVETSERQEESEQEEEEEDEEVVEEPSSGPSSAPMRGKGRTGPVGSSSAASTSRPEATRQYCTMTC